MNLFQDAEIRISKLPLGPYDTNCYVVSCSRTKEAVIIDAPAQAGRILDEARRLKVKYILITHAHPDHLGALAQLRTVLRVPVGVHAADAHGLPQFADFNLEDGAKVRFGRQALKVLHAPGHTRGSICLLSEKHLFLGDTLFPGGPGHTASPEAFQQIVASITGKLFALPDDTNVYPGHGADTTIGQAKQEYAVFAAKTHPPELCGDVLWASS